jgi:hypothetical protein
MQTEDMESQKRLNVLQTDLVRQILLLPDDLMKAVIQTSRSQLREEMIMEIGDAVRFCSNFKTADKIQNYLFQKFLIEDTMSIE